MLGLSFDPLMPSRDRYIQLTNDVLVVNYWGELLAVELLAALLAQENSYAYRKLLTRQLLDETRHANITREFLLDRGRDPIRDDTVAASTYAKLFEEWVSKSFEEALTFLGTNERSSSRNFASLIKVGQGADDEPLVSLYSEILGDEANHARNIFAALPKSDELAHASAGASAQMKATFNLPYGKLAQAYPDAFGWGP